MCLKSPLHRAHILEGLIAVTLEASETHAQHRETDTQHLCLHKYVTTLFHTAVLIKGSLTWPTVEHLKSLIPILITKTKSSKSWKQQAVIRCLRSERLRKLVIEENLCQSTPLLYYIFCMHVCLSESKVLCVNSYQMRAYWQLQLRFWEKSRCHQTLTRSTAGRGRGKKLLKTNASFQPFCHFSSVAVIASVPDWRHSVQRVCACMWRVLHMHIVECAFMSEV